MEKVLSYANKVGDAFTSTEIYKEYSALYEGFKDDEKLMYTLKTYRTIKLQNYLTYTVKNEDDSEMDSQTIDLHNELLKNEDMKRFLELEEDLMKGLTDLYKVIGDKCVLHIEVTQ